MVNPLSVEIKTISFSISESMINHLTFCVFDFKIIYTMYDKSLVLEY